MSKRAQTSDGQDPNLAEEVLRQAGKSEEEVTRTGRMDRADDRVEGMFSAQYRTINSPAHRAVWNRQVPLDEFCSKPTPQGPWRRAMDLSKGVLKGHVGRATLRDENNKVTRNVLQDLGTTGYWGMLISQQYGGQGAPVLAFMRFLTEVASECDPTVAGLASVHGCIGAVDPVRTFGNDQQKQYFLPMLASGRKISGFALTEPNAGSDLTALRTTARLDGDSWVVNGEKLFITNAIHGRVVGLVCMIDKVPQVLVVELPESDTDTFHTVKYGLHALKHTYNNGLSFNNFRVPKGNLLSPPPGSDGLTIAYHGLNLGRIALCANAAGVMRLIAKSMLPWASYRKTYGEYIGKRQLVQIRLARLAGSIVGADALVGWCSTKIDEGYRGELECIIAKIFGSEAQKEAAIEFGMKTHGGRSFLHGHMIGDNIHEYLAPCIYEGEGEMLGMAFFKALIKDHGTNYMLPIGNALNSVKKGSYLGGGASFLHHAARYAKWNLGTRLLGGSGSAPSSMNPRLRRHVEFALETLPKTHPLEISGAMVKYQMKLADEQGAMTDLSQRVQDTITMLVTALDADRIGDEVTIRAADILCQDLHRKLRGGRKTAKYFKDCAKLGQMIEAGEMRQLHYTPSAEIMQQYSQD